MSDNSYFNDMNFFSKIKFNVISGTLAACASLIVNLIKFI